MSRKHILQLLGLGLLLTAVGGGMLLFGRPAENHPVETLAQVQPTETLLPAATQAPSGQLERSVPRLPSRTPTPTQTPTATPLPSATPTATPVDTAVPETNAPIVWNQDEKNALTWLCAGEVGGMGAVRDDACLSVISTVRARYAYPNGFAETDVISTLLRPNQFNVPIETETPHPDSSLMAVVEAYAAGARGSCNGYLYFNSIPDGPSECRINGAGGLFIQFHNTW